MTDFRRHMPEATSSLKRRRSLWSYTHLDATMMLLLMLLCAFGLFVLYSASGESEFYVRRQFIHMVAGFAALIILAQFPPAFLGRWSPIAFMLAVALLVGVEVAGVGAKGAKRWLQLPGFRIQPSELMKLALPLAVAYFITLKPLPASLLRTCGALAIIGIPAGLIAKQPDLGTALLISASGLFVVFFSGIKWRYIFVSIGSMIPVGYALWNFYMKDYQKRRVATLFDPESDPLGAGWNIIQSKTAIGSGGFDGKGWLSGTQSQLDFLPESHTDFIIAVVAEELGLIGVVFLILLYIAIICRGLIMASQIQHSFGRLVGGSVILTFFVYVLVNMGMVSGILPVVGVPLPLVSYGGTSLVTLMCGFGLLMSMHRHKTMMLK